MTLGVQVFSSAAELYQVTLFQDRGYNLAMPLPAREVSLHREEETRSSFLSWQIKTIQDKLVHFRVMLQSEKCPHTVQPEQHTVATYASLAEALGVCASWTRRQQ